MIRKLLILCALIPSIVFADTRYRELNPTNQVEDSMCIPALDGEGFLHVDEDVSGLIIKVINEFGVTVATYDAAGEIEDISVIGERETPSANNVRVSPQANGGADCTQMMFADAVYGDTRWVIITVSDGQTTIMDFTRWVYLNGGTTVDAGMVIGGATSIVDVVSQTEFELDQGHFNQDAYIDHEFCVSDATQWGCAPIVTYDPSPAPVVTIESGKLNFTVQIGDEYRIYKPLRSGSARETSLLAVGTTVSDVENRLGDPLDPDEGTIAAQNAASLEILNNQQIATGTCDSGTTTTCVDAALTQADNDYWQKGLAFVSTSGTTDDQRACIIDFDAAADQITFSSALTQAITTNSYALVSEPTCGGAVLTDNSITAAKIATSAIDADAIAADAIGAVEIAAGAIDADALATDASAEIAAAHLAEQRILTGTCDSGSTTTCVDNALTQADETQIDDRLICFDDSWCGLITGFTPGTDTVTTTKVAPSTRASKAYTIFPSTLQ